MCECFYLDAREDALKATLHPSTLPVLPPRYNFAPSQVILGEVAGEEGRIGRWFRGADSILGQGGQVRFSHDQRPGRDLGRKTGFSHAALWRHRCLIPASGYFEGRTGTEDKQPDCIRPTEGPWLVFTGLYRTGRTRKGRG